MTALLNFLARSNVMMIMLAAFLLIGFMFAPAAGWVGGPMLDMSMTGEVAALRLAEMTDQQKQNHIWVTAVIDSAYPLAYGGFLAGFVTRFAPPTWRPWVAFPALGTVLVDFAENGVQVAALTGQTGALAAKSILTPLKFGLFSLAGILAIVAILLLLWRQIFQR